MSETVVMIHGMWGGPWYWSCYRPLFEKRGYRCVTPTLRYHDMDPHARPDPGLGRVSLLDYAADLEKEIRMLDASPILVGHSIGWLAGANPGQGSGAADSCIAARHEHPQAVGVEDFLRCNNEMGFLEKIVPYLLRQSSI